MRCLSCDARLTDFEATRRGLNTDEFIDLCNRCYSSIKEDVLTVDRSDLEEEDGIDNDSHSDICVNYELDRED